MPQSPDQDHMGFRSPSDQVNRSLYANLSLETGHHSMNNVRLPVGVHAARHGQDARPSAAQDPNFSSAAQRNEHINPQSNADNVRPSSGDGIPCLNVPRPNRRAAELALRRTTQIYEYEGDDSLSGVSETHSRSRSDYTGDSYSSYSSEDTPNGLLSSTPNLNSKTYIIDGNSNKRKNDKFKRVKAAQWMKAITPQHISPGYIKCVLMTNGLPVRVGTTWKLPLNGQRTYVTWTNMVEDLQLEFFDKATFKETKDPAGDTYARIYVTKNRAVLVTPVAQGTAAVPIVDTAQGANTSAAHAMEAAAGASPSNTGRAGNPNQRIFRPMEQSQRRQVEDPAQNHQVGTTAAVENPVQVEIAPVNAPLPPPIVPNNTSVPTAAADVDAAAPATAIPAAATATAGPSRKRKSREIPSFEHFGGIMSILERHNVCEDTINEFYIQLAFVTPENWHLSYVSLVRLDKGGDSEKVQEWADEVAARFKERK